MTDMQYYIEQPIAYNSVLGAAAFVLSSLEVESLDKLQNTPQGGGNTTQRSRTSQGGGYN